MAVHTDLIDLIRCPKCRGKLTLRAGGGTEHEESFECAACRLLYPVIDDIPQLLIDEAKPLEA